MRPDDEAPGCPHGLEIEHSRDVPGAMGMERGPLTPIQNTVFVDLAAGRIPGMKIVRDAFCRQHADIFGEERVEPAGPFIRSHRAVRTKACHLSKGMDARIR